MELSRKAEDYLEATLVIAREKGYAKIRDVALTLGVKPPSVVEMVRKLDALGLVVYRKYDGVTLTPDGEEIGKNVKDRHDTLKAFLEIINVPEKTADEDACTMEHELDPKTVQQIKNLVAFVRTAPDRPKWLKHFTTFCETGEHSCEEKEL